MSSSPTRKTASPCNDNDAGPAKKKQKQQQSSPKQQSSLLQFFPAKQTEKENKITNTTKAAASAVESKASEKEQPDKKPSSPGTPATARTSSSSDSAPSSASPAAADAAAAAEENAVPELVIPTRVSPDPQARWKVVKNCMLVRSTKEEPRTKAAAFDVDGTLLVWRIAGWPSQFQHYELWSTTIISKLQALHDQEGYKLVLFSNQGAIRSAHTGKKATFIKALFEWLAQTINRPVHIVLSTDKKLGYHKPNAGMWEICEKHCNSGIPFEIEKSFFVGDSVAVEGDPQGGVDEQFAQNVGKLKGSILKFYPPTDYFGPSDSEKRKRQGILADYDAPPTRALEARKALLSGYLEGPILLILTGVQGSGKSTFCQQLVLGTEKDSGESEGGSAWVHLSQDTINKGKPGKREMVEAKTREALLDGCSVVVDRTHLDPAQRKYFVDIAKELKVPVHVLVFQTSKDIIAKRVRERTNHPGGVEGDKGVRVALMHMSKMVLPNYKDEGFDLISCVKREDGVKRLSSLYSRIIHTQGKASSAITLERYCSLSCGTVMPTMALGMMDVGKRIAENVVSKAKELGWRAIDTAPTYNNEEQIGKALAKDAGDVFVIAKVPKRATQPEQVRDELEASLRKMRVKKAALLLLHWPCDVIEAGTLKTVWQAMEQCVADGKCQSIGVSNFNVDALRQLLPLCTILPAVNQVERHPLLPQMELLGFCLNEDIAVQAYSPLGHSKLLTHETIVQVAEQRELTPAQVLLEWNLQHGVSVVCKCAKEHHQKEVFGIYDTKPSLSVEDMKILDGIKDKKRYVSPPFMLKPGNVYTWKD